MDHFLYVSKGKNSWKRYTASFLVILLFLCFGDGLYIFFNFLFKNDSTYFDEANFEFIGINPLVDFLFSHLFSFGLFIGIWIAMKTIHKRTILSLVTFSNHLDWKQIFFGFRLYFLLFAGFTLLDFLMFSNHYQWNDVNWSEFTLLFFIVLLLVPLQTTAEELFFRGFLLQWIAKKIKNPYGLSLIMALLFGLVHFSNPEMEQSVMLIGLEYVFAGFVFTLISAQLGSSELSIGAHAANNMFIAWFIANENSINGAIPSLFKVVEENSVISLIGSMGILSIFYLVSIRKFAENEKKKDLHHERDSHHALHS